MKTYRKITCSEVDKITCDRCGRTEDSDGMEGNEFLEHYASCGYISVFGDTNHIRLDLCQHCVRDVLSPWITILDADGNTVSAGAPR